MKIAIKYLSVAVVAFATFTGSIAGYTAKKTSMVYIVHNVTNAVTRTQVARTGAIVLEAGRDYILIEATAKEKLAIEELGLKPVLPTRPEERALAFPSTDSHFHNYN